MTQPTPPVAEFAPDPVHPEPTVPVTSGWLLLYACAWLGFWLLVMLPGQVMLAMLAKEVDADSKERLLSIFQAVMMLTIVVAVPLIGYLCDRTRLPWGRRRAWALGGLAVAGSAFVLVGTTSSALLICLLLAVVSLGEAAVLVALSAMIADQVPVAQRGRASAAFGVPQVIALAGGMILVTEVINDVSTGWMVIGLLGFVVGLPFLLGKREPAPLPGTGVQGTLRHNITLPARQPRRTTTGRCPPAY